MDDHCVSYFFNHILMACSMKGTEVPNPQCSSACDCICVLTRNRSMSRDDSLILAMHILFRFCLCKVHSRVSDAL